MTRRLITTSNERSGKSSVCASPRANVIAAPCSAARLPCDGQHLLGRIHAGDPGAAAGHQQRGATGPGPDVENGTRVDAADEVRQHAGLSLGDQLADRSAEPAIVEAACRVGIAVERVAVVIARRLLAHATSLTSFTPGTGAPGTARRAPDRPVASARDTRRSCISSRPEAAPAGRRLRRDRGRRGRRASPAAKASGVGSVRIEVSSDRTWVWVSSRVATIARPDRRY